MGLIRGLMDMLFGSGLREMRQTVELFRENADQSAERALGLQQAALRQFGREFGQDDRSGFDRFIDGLNRLPRPGLALGTLALFIAAMINPAWFAARMQGIALVPEPLWWLLGVIVSFYFGARHQAKGQAFQTRLSQSLLQLPQQLAELEAQRKDGEQVSETEQENPALRDWHRQASSAGKPATM